MEIIAKQKEGYLIHATKQEVNSILTAVNGKAPDNIQLGQKMPAIDYATTINKVKALSEDHNYQMILQKTEYFNDTLDGLREVIENAALISIDWGR